MNKSKLMLILFTVFFAVNFGFSQVGINTDNPLSTLDINGNLSLKAVVLNGNGSGNGGTSVVINDGVYISLNPQTADDKFELPNPTLFPGRVYIIRNIQNGVTAQLITTTNLLFPKNSTVGSSQIYMYEGNLRTVIVISDGQNWTYIN